MKLNLGCGACTPAGWTNVDYALGARVMKWPLIRPINRKLRLFDLDWDDHIVIHNLLRPFPWAEGSADAVYSSHTLEHIKREDGLRFLAECFKVLKSGGVIRIVVPDLAVIVQRYNKGEIRADRFIEALDVLYPPASNKIKEILRPYTQYPHKCMYDTPTLEAVLAEAGFTQVASRGAFDSAIEDITLIELEDRTVDAVIVEAIKP